MHRHSDAHPRSSRQPEKVDMDRPVGDDVELTVARQDALLAPVHLEFEDGCQKAAGVDELVDLLEVHRDRHGLLTAAIDDGGDTALATAVPGPPRAGPAARPARWCGQGRDQKVPIASALD